MGLAHRYRHRPPGVATATSRCARAWRTFYRVWRRFTADRVSVIQWKSTRQAVRQGWWTCAGTTPPKPLMADAIDNAPAHTAGAGQSTASTAPDAAVGSTDRQVGSGPAWNGPPGLEQVGGVAQSIWRFQALFAGGRHDRCQGRVLLISRRDRGQEHRRPFALPLLILGCWRPWRDMERLLGSR